MSTTVYAVTIGQYSDYQVASLYYSESEAREVADKLNAECRYAHADVEEFELE